MSSTRSVMWCRPGPRFSMYFAIGESGDGRFEKLEAGFADRDEVRAHLLRRDVFGRFDVQAERVAIERERGVEILHRDPDVIENGFHFTDNHHEGTKTHDAF